MSTETSVPTGGGQATDRAQEAAQQVAGQAQEKAQEAASQAKDKLREQLDQRSSQAAEQINQQASDLRSVSESLRQQGKGGPADAADRLAGYAEKVGGYLRERDSDALLSDAEDFARRQPWAVAAGALTLGFAASRFLRASSSKRYSTRHAAGASAPATPPASDVATAPTVGLMPPATPRVGGAPPVGSTVPPVSGA